MALQGAPLEVASLTRAEPVSYAKEIAPVFKKSCVACHNASKAKVKLNLENVSSMLKGSSEGKVIVPGKADESLLFLVAAHREEEFMPPPKNKSNAPNLNPEQLALLKLWIDQGAKDDDMLAAEREVKFSLMSGRVKAIYSVALSPDNQYVAAGRGNRIFVYDLSTGQLTGELSDPGIADKGAAAHLDIVGCLAFSRDGLLASGGFRTIKFWRRPEGLLVNELEATAGVPRSAATSSDGKRALVGDETGQVKLYSIADKAVRTFKDHDAPVTGVGFGETGVVVTASLDKTLKIRAGSGEGEARVIEFPAAIHSMAIVSGGMLAACGCEDGIIRLVDLDPAVASNADQEQPVNPAAGFIELKGHQGAVVSLRSFGAEANQLLSGGADSTLRHWKLGNGGGEQVRQVGNGTAPGAVAVSADGMRFASVSGNDTLRLWDGSTGKLTADVKTGWRKARAEKIAASGVSVAAKLSDERKKQFDAAEKKLKDDGEAVKKAQQAEKAAVEEQGKKMPEFKASEESRANAETEVKLKGEAKLKVEAEVKTKEEVKLKAQAELKLRQEAETKAQAEVKAATEAEAKLMAEARVKAAVEAKMKVEAEVKVRAEEEKKARAELAAREKELKAAQDKAKKAGEEHAKKKKEFDEVERKHLEAVRNREVAERFMKRAEEVKGVAETKLKEAKKALDVSKVESEAAKKASAEAGSALRSVEFSKDGTRVLAATEDGSIYSWAAKTGIPSRVIAAKSGAAVAMCLAGDTVLTVAGDKAVRLWNLNPDWVLERTIGAINNAKLIVDRVNSIAFSPDGSLLASGGGVPSRSGVVNVWQVKDGKEISKNTESHSDTISAITFSPDGSRIATSATDRFVKVFNTADATLERAFEGHTSHVLDVSWSADGLTLASAGADNVVKVWDFEAGTQKQTVKGHSKAVTSVGFVGTGETLLTGSGDKSVRLSNQPLPDAGTFIHAAESSSDGTIIAAGGEDSLLRVWTAADKKLLFKLP
ncbi:MAG: c-type cytochrome domain-containing protein [Verrucomicrobiales bacterium]